MLNNFAVLLSIVLNA